MKTSQAIHIFMDYQKASSGEKTIKVRDVDDCKLLIEQPMLR